MTAPVVVDHVTKRFGRHAALDQVSIRVDPHSILGLLGRNGAGKTTLMRTITAQELPTSGSVRVFGEDPYENDRVLSRTAFVKESQVYPDIQVRHVLRVASWFYPHWDADLAGQLVDDFELPLTCSPKKLSRGQHSAVGIVLGLASRAELTIFDEPYLGLDAVSRHRFYDRLLADYAEHPRTVVLSTHLIDEVSNLLDHVVVLDKGRVVLDASADDARDAAVAVSGPTARIEAFLDGRPAWRRESVGGRTSVTLGRRDGDVGRAAELGLTVSPVSLQEYLVRSTTARKPNGEAA